MFSSFRRDFRDYFQIKEGDDIDEVNRRCAYTREYKLAAIDYALNTWERKPTDELVYISRYYVAKRLKIHGLILRR